MVFLCQKGDIICQYKEKIRIRIIQSLIITLPSDINLKPSGKGILLFMLRKPDDWRFNYKNFKKELGIGKKAIRSLIKNLEELKYLKRERVIGENDHYEWIYYVYEIPYDKELPYSVKGYMLHGSFFDDDIY